MRRICHSACPFFPFPIHSAPTTGVQSFIHSLGKFLNHHVHNFILKHWNYQTRVSEVILEKQKLWLFLSITHWASTKKYIIALCLHKQDIIGNFLITICPFSCSSLNAIRGGTLQLKIFCPHTKCFVSPHFICIMWLNGLRHICSERGWQQMHCNTWRRQSK